MRVIYYGIDMMPIKLHELTVQPVYDDAGVDYLFSRGTVVIEAYINSDAPFPNAPGRFFGDSPGSFVNYQAGPSPFAVPTGGSRGIPPARAPSSATANAVTAASATLGTGLASAIGTAVAGANAATIPLAGAGGVFPGRPATPARLPKVESVNDRNPPSLQVTNGAPFLIGENTGTTTGSAKTDTKPIFQGPLRNPTVLTHADIRHRLAMPHKQLYIYTGPGMAESGRPPGDTSNPATWGVGANVLIAAPLTGSLYCDANNGPKPHLFDVKTAMGDGNTLIVFWGCEFFFNESFQNGVSPISALLANRFSQEHHVDKDGWTTIRTEGEAVFRTDLIYGAKADPNRVSQIGQNAALSEAKRSLQGFVPPAAQGLEVGDGINPDDVRSSLFLPIYDGFTREIDYVKGNEDGTGVKYGYTDTQQKVNFVAGPFVNPDMPGTGASSISVLHRQAIVSNNQDILGSALQGFERVVGLQANRHIARHAEPQMSTKKKKKKPPPSGTP